MKRYCVILGLLVLSLAETSCSLISKTPRGVCPTLVHDITLDSNLDMLTLLKDSAIIQQIDFPYFHNQKNGISIQLINGFPQWDEEVFQQIALFQYSTMAESEAEYQSYKNTFTESSEDRLYKEFGDESNKYFIAYKVIHFNRNHGIPMGFINHPDIIICFKKNNYFLYTSYSTYSDNKPDYVTHINSNLIYLSEALKILKEKNK